MNISYKWLNDYLKTSLDPHEIAAILTPIGSGDRKRGGD